MAFRPSQDDLASGSTTQPNTPQRQSSQDENNPNGDFARLIPTSKAARLAFHKLVLAFKQYPDKYRWQQRLLHVREVLENLDAEVDEHSTGDETQQPSEPILVHTGFWRLNLCLRAANRQLGWVVGRGRWGVRSVDSYGAVDILLTPDRDPLIHSRHARLLHVLDSNAFIIVADKKLRVGGSHLDPTRIATFGQKATEIAFGNLEYSLLFTDLDPGVYRTQLNELSSDLQYTGYRPADYIDPTPTDTDYSIKDKYIIRSSFAVGSSCFVCSAVDKNTGASVAVKKIIALNPRDRLRVRREVEVMKRLLSSDHFPSSIAKFVEYISINPSNSSGASECFIISQPLIASTLGKLVTLQSISLLSRLLLLEQMLQGLAFLHTEGCMHRDIKPENILASVSPVQAVIIDFGCATWENSSNDHLKGTIRYLAPEVIALKDKIAPHGATYDCSADVWSMGLTALELLIGSRIKWAKISNAIYTDILLPRVNEQIPDESASWAFDLIRQMLDWNPETRITKLRLARRTDELCLALCSKGYGFANDRNRHDIQSIWPTIFSEKDQPYQYAKVHYGVDLLGNHCCVFLYGDENADDHQLNLK